MVDWPNAMQVHVDTHDTDFRTLAPAFALGVVIDDQFVPSHSDNCVLAWPFSAKVPTVLHDVADTHDTDVRLLLPIPTVGLVTAAQAVPSQTIINFVVPDTPGGRTLVRYEPTATQNVADAHETPFAKFMMSPGFGLDVVDQTVPSHTIASDRAEESLE